MAEYIEREALIEHFRGKCVAKYPLSFVMGLYAAADEVSKLPAADVAPVVHGRWLDGKCTNCTWEAPDFISYVGCELDDWEPTPYCPNCGTRMDGE